MTRPPWVKTIWWLTVALIIFIVSTTGLAYGYIAERNSNRNTAALRGSCQFWRDLSALPLTAQSTKTAFTIIADARIAYARQSCVAIDGSLPPAPKQVAALLPPGVH